MQIDPEILLRYLFSRESVSAPLLKWILRSGAPTYMVARGVMEIQDT